MKNILFLGNSHLSSLKFAYDELQLNDLECKFFCARGADLFFTVVEDGKIRPVSSSDLDRELLNFFYGKFDEGRRHVYNRAPMADVETQFINTGGSAEIELQDIDAIFYVLGISPYDFVRLGDDFLFASDETRRERIENILSRFFIFRDQLLEIKNIFPRCHHYYIGKPLCAKIDGLSDRGLLDAVIKIRNDVRSVSRQFLFDDVFMQTEKILVESLAATRPEYCRGGRQESELFQRQNPTRSDLSHMNRDYGKVVFEDFIVPLVGQP